MTRRARALVRGQSAAEILLPLVVALPPLWWYLIDLRVAALTALGRDQGFFQYIGYAIQRGDRLYRDIQDVSGPLTAYVHMVFQLLGGRDERVFRILDLSVNSAVFFAVGAFLVGSCLRAPGPPQRRFVTRLTWGLAAWVTLGVQYLGINFDYWMISQRETIGDWFVLTSLVLQVHAQAVNATEERRRHGEVLLAVAAFIGVTAWFCKATFFLFTGAQAIALLLDNEMRSSLRRRALAFAAGATASGLVQLVLLAIFGDIGRFLRGTFGDVPRTFVYLWPRLPSDLFGGKWGERLALGVGCGMMLVVLIAAREVPRRALSVALAPLAAIAAIVIQRKGTTYHYQPLVALVHLQLIFVCIWLSEKFLRDDEGNPGPSPRRSLERIVAVGAATALGFYSTADAAGNYFFKNKDLRTVAATEEARAADAYLRRFDNGSYSRVDLEHGARYLREKVPAGQRVLYWGMDVYLLFLADRLSATSAIASYNLNPTGLLNGGPGLVPDEAKKAEILAMWAESARQFAAELKARPPAALAITDGIYWGPDGWADLKKWCPDAFAFLEPRFKEATRFGKVRVFLPR